MDFGTFMRPEGRTLPVFLLIDVSGSMRGKKIDTVNVAIKEMINTFKGIENPRGVINLCIITFDDQATVIKPLSAISDADVFELQAGGNTSMGLSFEKVTEMIEDYNVVSSRSYTPTIVLISDGNPTDYRVYGKDEEQIKKWPSLNKLHTSERSSKAVRLAMGIGDDVNLELLKAFVNNPQIPIIRGKDNSTISKFFQWVTMTVSVRSVSADPNNIPQMNTAVFDDDEVDWSL